MRTGGTPAEWKVIPIAPGADIFKSPDPDGVFLGNPSIVTMPGGRIIVSLDMTGPGTKHLTGAKLRESTTGRWIQGKVFVSGDNGATWTWKADFPFYQAQLFRVGSTLYLMGQAGDFRVMKSMDGGDTWGKAAEFNVGEGEYTLTSANVLCARDSVYLAVMKITREKDRPGTSFSPIIMRARQGVDLASRKAWTCSDPVKPFQEFAPHECLDYFGVRTDQTQGSGSPAKSGSPGALRSAGQFEWDSPLLVEIKDQNHFWHDPDGRTVHLLASTRLRRSNLAAVAAVVEDAAGMMHVSPVPTIYGTKTALLPVPGGHFKFDIIYDDVGRLYWLACNPSTESMLRPDRTRHAGAAVRHDDRQRLCLYFSRNLIDWNFAACVDSGTTSNDLRHCCSLAISRNDLYAVCCSGQLKPGTRGCTDRVTFHMIPAFRELEY